jgi:hypothetical protein
MIVAVDPVQPEEFIPDSEKKKKVKTKFMFLPLLENEKANAMMQVLQAKGVMPEGFATELVRDKITGWENFKDSKGVELKFIPETEMHNRIPWDVQVEFGSHILMSSGFMEVQKRKN